VIGTSAGLAAGIAVGAAMREEEAAGLEGGADAV